MASLEKSSRIKFRFRGVWIIYGGKKLHFYLKYVRTARRISFNWKVELHSHSFFSANKLKSTVEITHTEHSSFFATTIKPLVMCKFDVRYFSPFVFPFDVLFYFLESSMCRNILHSSSSKWMKKNAPFEIRGSCQLCCTQHRTRMLRSIWLKHSIFSRPKASDDGSWLKRQWRASSHFNHLITYRQTKITFLINYKAFA